ncbi:MULTISPECIES: alpha-(1-_3)-arabinofuranosyltransferase domain-containing protein [Parafrankia]|nr:MULTISPECIES: alpha-(1->3)-arabinofuranosyltransferase family protein [Parafrankia]
MFVGFATLFLLQAPGKLTADTKLDVPLEPWRFMEAATHLWNSTSDFGYLPNQYAGYLFPMGPFFGIGDLLGVPPWITQRLWMAVLLTLAAWGTVRLAEVLGIGGHTSRVLAGLSYALSPMFLGKIGATSVAMAGASMLPWMVVPLIVALRPDGAGGADTGHRDDDGEHARTLTAARLSPRRAAALSGLAVLGTGGVNATVTLCVLLGPAVVLAFAGGGRRAWALRAWWCLSVVLATAWWVLALMVQGRYGINFLPFTETAETTTATTSVGETLRGAADWMAYLELPMAWLPAAREYVSSATPVVASALVAGFGLVGLTRRDLPARRFLLVTLAAGVVAVSSAYSGEPVSPLAGGLRSLLSEPFGFLRNVYKFQPVVRLPLALGLAHLLAVAMAWRRGQAPERHPGRVLPRRGGARWSGGRGGGASDQPARLEETMPLAISAAARNGAGGAGGASDRTVGGPVASRRRVLPVAVSLAAVAALVVAMLPLLQGKGLQPRPFDKVPDYWTVAADWLADHPEGGRTLVLPGAPFGEYDWGRPLDEPMQWLADSPWGVRNLIPLGGVGTTRLLDGIEEMMATGDTPGLATTLARAGVGMVLIRNDIEIKDWDIPASTDQLHRALESSGLQLAASFGPTTEARTSSKARLIKSLRRSEERVPALEVWTVPGGARMVQAYPLSTGVVVSGGPEATVQLSDQGLLGPDRATVLASDLAEADEYSAAAGGSDADPTTTLAPIADPPPASKVITPTTALAVTDTNTRRDFTFGIVHDGTSYLLGPNESVAGRSEPPRQWTDRPTAGHQTVAGYADGMSVTASSYGFELIAAPDFAPQAAVDGQTSTSWTAIRRHGATSQGEWIQLDVGRELEAPYIDIRLLAEGDWRPEVHALRVTTERGSVVTQVKPVEDIQRLAVPAGESRWFKITLEKVTNEDDPSLGAGLREIDIPGASFHRYAQTPSDLTDTFESLSQGLVAYSFERYRADPLQPFGGSEELTFARKFDSPREMTFTLRGTATAIPPPAGSAVDTSNAPLVIPCGEGPSLIIDGVRYDLEVSGVYSSMATARPFQLKLCTGNNQVRLGAGSHLLSVDLGGATMVVDAISMVGEGAAVSTDRPRTTAIGHWGSELRTVDIGAGAASFVSVRENANASWTATLNGQELTAVRIDGWAQGWIVPAGQGGTIVIENHPGQTFRRNLLIGLGLVLILTAIAVVPDSVGAERRRRRQERGAGPGLADRLADRFARLSPAGLPGMRALGRLRLPALWTGLALATLSVFLVAGVVALVVPLIVLLGRRLRWLPGLLALAGMVGSGIVVSTVPSAIPFSGEGAFSWPAQALGALAFAATISALALRPAEAVRRWPESSDQVRHVPNMKDDAVGRPTAGTSGSAPSGGRLPGGSVGVVPPPGRGRRTPPENTIID